MCGDRIFLFGFSRGAYTARSLGGFIGRCGLLDLSTLTDKEAWERIANVYGGRAIASRIPKASGPPPIASSPARWRTGRWTST
jgi:hypothetical protein